MAALNHDEIVDRYPLSPLQQGMLFHSLRERGSGMYISQAVARYDNLDCAALRKAWQLVIDRHPVLRTSFYWDDPENPEQFVHRHADTPLRVEDWCGMSPSEQNHRLRELQREERERGFDLAVPSQFRLIAIQVTGLRWLLVNTHHHIILDGWSGGLLATEVARTYEAFRRDRSPSLEPPVPFSSYIRWLEKQDLTATRSFWRDYLAEVALPTPLPAERELGPGAGGRMHVQSWEIVLDDGEAAQVERFARQCEVTLHTVIQAVWPLLLSRYTGQETVVFGMLVSGRPPELPGVEAIVGMFLNTIPCRVNVSDDLSVGKWLRKMHEERVQLQRYEHSPLMLVQQLSRIPGGQPLFNSIVARKDVTRVADVARREAGKRRREKSDQATFQQNYPMLLNITASDGIQLKMTYDARKFLANDVARIMEQLRYLLVLLSTDAERRLGEVWPASADELHQLIHAWNDTRLPIEHPPAIADLVAQEARREPGRMAAKSGRQGFTFGELDRRVNLAAAQLVSHGLGCGDLVAVGGCQPLQQLVAVLAVLRIGARCLPLDDSGSASIRELPASARCRALINDRESDLPAGTSGIVVLNHDQLGGEIEPGIDVAPPPGERRDHEPVLLLRSSDGVLFEVDRWFLASRFLARSVAFAPESEVALWSPPDSLAFFSELFACWQAMGSVYLPERTGSGGGVAIIDSLCRSAGDRVTVTPTILARILRDQEVIKKLSGVGTWICSGESLWPELADRFFEAFPDASLVNLFSTTSLGPCLAWEVPRARGFNGIRLGYALPNVRAYLLVDTTRLAPVGVVGELLLAVDGANRKLVSATVAPGILPDDERVFATGVLARRWNDGSIEYLGEKADLAENAAQGVWGLATRLRLEREIRKTPIVDEAVVLVPEMGKRTAFISTGYEQLDLESLHKRLCRLVTQEFPPTHYQVLDGFPMDRYGRTNRSQLLNDGGRDLRAVDFTTVLTKPKSELERIIADVWMEVLRLDKISTEDNFFEIGGHSLAATKATARLTKILKSDIHLKGIFEAPTVASFAEWLQSDRHQEELPFAVDVAERGKDAPLTFTQRQMWVLGQLFPRLPIYTIPSNAVFTGEMQVDAFRLALRDVIERHEILRTVFVVRDGDPRQVVKPPPDEVEMELIDLTHLPENERMEKARLHGAQFGRTAWDLERGPLIRPQLVKLSEDRYLLNTVFHHIIADGPSMGVFLADLESCYKARRRGQPPRLPAMPLQFADFAVWEWDNIKGDLFKRQLEYWRKTLDGTALLEIPMDFPRPAVHGFHGEKVKFEISSIMGEKLRCLGQEEGATIFMCLLAVYQLLLHKYSGQDDVVVGSAMTNRIRVELERLIGLFVNTIPLRTDFSGDPTFREVLQRVKSSCLGAYANMDLPFEEIIAQLQPDRDLSRQGSPLFQFMLIHNPAGRGRREDGGNSGPSLRPGDPHNDTGYANFDLLLSTRDNPDGLIKVTMAYDTELFRRETIDRMIGHFQRMVQAVTESPDEPLSHLEMVGEEEREEVLLRWNGRQVRRETRMVHQIIAEHARNDPDHIAVLYRGQRLSYRVLEDRAGWMAAKLQRAGVKPESVVAICLPRSDRLILAILSVLKAGAAFLPVDSGYPVDRITHMLDETDCRFLVADHLTGPIIQKQRPGLQVFHINDMTAPEGSEKGRDLSPLLEHHVVPNNLAYIIFTSGSTGLPKGVMVEHHNLSNIVRSQIAEFGIDRNSRVLQMLSIGFDASVGEIFRTLAAGGTLVMADQDALLPGPGLVKLLKENHITTMAISPTALGAMPDSSEELEELQTITMGGEPCPQAVADRWARGRKLLNAYGPTETTIGATLAVNWDSKAKPPLGRPLPGVKVYVVDKNGNLAPVGTPGELYIGGVGVARGYLNRPDLTAEKFIADPFSERPGDRVYRTGDLVRWLSSGILDFLGRIDQQVKIRGFRIELGEIETALGKHRDIAHCAVAVDERNNIKRLVAYAVPRSGAVLDTTELRLFLKKTLPEYMVPAFFVPLDHIPTTRSGKVDRLALPSPNPDEEVSGSRDSTPPANDLEKKLVLLWSEVLGLKKIGVLDNFFGIGGDSISAIRVAARANQFSLTLAARDIFVNQTIRDLAEYLHDREPHTV